MLNNVLNRRSIRIPLLAGLVVTYGLFLGYVAEQVGWSIALRGFYPVVGALIGYYIYFGSSQVTSSDSASYFISLSNLEKLSIATSFLFISSVLILGIRWELLVIALPVLVYSAVRSILERSNGSALRLLVLTSLLPPTAKVLTTGYYFGNGDLLKDIPEAVALVREGSISALPAWYPRFPFTYLLTGSTSILTNVDMYVVYHTLGILEFSLLPVIMYCTLRSYSDGKTAIVGALTTLLVYPLLQWPTYFIPVAHALIFFAYLTFLASRLTKPDWRWNSLIFAVIFATLLTHHLSVVFILNILLVATFTHWVVGSQFKQLAYILGYTTLFAVAYWIYNGIWFIRELLIAGFSVLRIALSGLSPTGIDTNFGGIFISGVKVFMPPEPRKLVDGFIWLTTPDGIVNILYISLILISFVVLYNSRQSTFFVYAVPGFLGAFAILKTPLVFPGLSRIRLFWSFVAVFYLAHGVKYLIEHIEHEGIISKPMVVLVILAVAAPMSAADDVRELRPDIDKQVEKEFSDRELAEINSAAAFAKFHSKRDIVTLHLTRLYINAWYNDLQLYTLPESPNNNCLGSDFLYRMSWENHSVITKSDGKTGPGGSRQVITSRRDLSNMIEHSEKYYTTGTVGIVRTTC